MRKIGLPFLVFLYLYPLTPKVLPFLNSRKVMAMFGALLVLSKLVTKIRNRSLLVKKELILIFGSIFLISIVAVGSILYNNTADFQFVNYTISNLIIFTSAYFLIKFVNSFNITLSRSYMIKLIVYCIAAQCMISIMLNFIPPLKEIELALLAFDESQINTMDRLAEERIIGFIISYFWAGAYCGMGLILIAYLIRYSYIQSKEIIWFVILYAFIFLVGMMMARTTVIGAALSFILLMLPKNNSQNIISIKNIKFITLLILVPSTVIGFLYLVMPELFRKLDYLIEFAFELFFNMMSTGELETASTNSLMKMFVLPEGLKTWVIGDGYWIDPIGGGYYMRTDIGLLRIIYYFGIIGLLAFSLSQLIILNSAFNKKLIIITIFSYFVILNIKGFFEYTPFLALLIVTYYQSRKSYRSSYIN